LDPFGAAVKAVPFFSFRLFPQSSLFSALSAVKTVPFFFREN